MKRIILSVTNDLVTDQRVHRIATTLLKNGSVVTLVGRFLPASLPLQRDYRTHRMKLFFKKGPLFYAEYNIRLCFYLLFAKVDILVSNDLDTLSANYLVSVIRKKVLVYDSHEYFTGVPEIQERKSVLYIWESIEKLIFPKLKHVYTVNESIARLYQEKYNKKIGVVRNMPLRVRIDKTIDRKDLELPVDKKIVLIQGAGINVDRGAEEALDAISLVNGAVLLIIGGGDVITGLKTIVKNRHMEEKVIFKPKMPYEQLICYTRLCDLGLSLDKDTNINYKYSLPNKLFDYIQAGIPVLCTNIVEVAKIVQSWQIGMVVNSLDRHELADIIDNMLIDKDQINLWRENLSRAAGELCWENEEKELLRIYEKLL